MAFFYGVPDFVTDRAFEGCGSASSVSLAGFFPAKLAVFT
jgi:hypothetical protein